MIIAVDFDGTIVQHKYPEIGSEIPFATATIRRLIAEQHQVILWTVRRGELLQEAIDWCKAQIDNLRIDTHPNNKTMQHLCTSRGFVECGKITIARDGSDRIIYHWIRK